MLRVVHFENKIESAFFSVDANGNFIFMNEGAGKLLNKAPDELQSMNLWGDFPDFRCSSFYQQYVSVVRQPTVMEFQDYMPSLKRWMELRAYPGPEGLIFYFRDITAIRQTEGVLHGKKHILEMIAKGKPLEDVLEQIVYTIEGLSRDAYCSILLVDQEGKRLLNGSAQSLPKSYNEAINGIPVSPGVGSCGTAAYYNKTVFVSDIASDPLWADYKDLALSHNLKACWSTPIRSHQGKVLGTFGMYYTDKKLPDPNEFELIECSSYLAGLAIEQKRREEERLRESEARYSLIADNMSDVICLMDTNLSIKYVSPSIKSFMGVSVQEFMNAPLSRWLHADELPLICQTRDAVMATRKSQCIELRCRGLDGNWLDVEANVTPILDEAGQVENLVVVSRDISQRKQTEFLLRESEQLYRSLFENHPDAVFSMNLMGECVTANEGVERLTGYRREELVNRDFYHIIDPEDWERTAHHFKLALEGTPQNYQIKLIHLNGDKITINTTNVPIIIGDRIVGVHGISKDVTELIEKRESLFESEERYRGLVENSLDAIGIVQKERWVFMNAAGMRLFHAANEKQLLGRPVYDILHSDFHEGIKENYRNLKWKNNTLNAVEIEWISLNGRKFVAETTGIPTLYNNKPAIQFIIRDISDRKEAEALMVKSEKLSIAGQLAAGIAHEIRNPLTAIKGFLQLIYRDLNVKPSYMDILHEELNRIELILTELLMLSKPQAVKYKPHDIQESLQHIVSLLQAEAAIKNVEFHIHFEEHPIYVNVDANQLKQVFINFIKNGMEAMENGGKLFLRVRRMQEGVEIQVEDQGCGIPAEVLVNIGLPFFTMKEKGTGLGLMVSYNIIKNHQGRVEVSSILGKGTTFTVYLPALSA